MSKRRRAEAHEIIIARTSRAGRFDFSDVPKATFKCLRVYANVTLVREGKVISLMTRKHMHTRGERFLECNQVRKRDCTCVLIWPPVRKGCTGKGGPVTGARMVVLGVLLLVSCS